MNLGSWLRKLGSLSRLLLCFELLGQPLLYLRLPGHPVPIGNLVNPQNHPVRNIKVDPLFLEQRARRFGQVEVVQDILAGSKPGFKSSGGCLIAHNMRFARFRVLGAR